MPENAKPLVAFKKGELLTAAKLNEIMDRVNRQRIDTGQSSGLVVQETNKGTVIRVFDAQATKGIFYAKSASVIPATTGTWPTLTLSSISSDIYQRTNGDLDLIEEDGVIYNVMPDPTIANHRLILSLNSDGTYDCIGMSCSVG